MITVRLLQGLPLMLVLLVPAVPAMAADSESTRFDGKYYRGAGDVKHLRLLEIARRMFEPDPELQNLTMLYEPKWNGLVEGPTWDAWWIQNSYGTTYSILPFLREPFLTFLQNSQDLWFDQMGDGKRVGAEAPFDWVAPDGCLCDAARPGWIVYKQGDGRTAIHDWGMEFTAAGLLLQSELLLIGRDPAAVQKYLPMLERCANFIETRRNPTNNLFLAGPAGNLLAPSYAGWRQPDGAYGKAYLAGLSITYIGALDRLIELEKLAKQPAKASFYSAKRKTARLGLQALTTPEGYFIRSLDPDGVRHGVFGAERHGYFEASPNHDAIAFRVVEDSQARRIYDKIASIPQLRPNVFILPNYPSYDDMYEKPEGLWGYGTWVNGGHWSTCEARMMLGYYRLGQFDDAAKSMRKLLTFAAKFRMDNPLTHCGSEVYQPNQPVNLCYDTFGPAAAFMRGLFEYIYGADGLTLISHLPPSISEFEQLNPVRLGKKQIYISTYGSGDVTGVLVNGRKWKKFSAHSVTLPFDSVPDIAKVEIKMGSGIRAKQTEPVVEPVNPRLRFSEEEIAGSPAGLEKRALQLENFATTMALTGFGDTYEAAHARLARETLRTVSLRQILQKREVIKPLPAASQAAADQSYVDTAEKLYTGLDKVLQSYAKSAAPSRQAMHRAWIAAGGERR